MSPGNTSPAEVLRAKRLEIVDDEGRVRAALGTDEEGVASLSVFDASGRLCSSLDAEEVPGHHSGLALYDTSISEQGVPNPYLAPVQGLGVLERGCAAFRISIQPHKM